MPNLTKLVLLPPPETVNRGLSRLRNEVMLELIGVPGTVPNPGETCGNITNDKLRGILEKRNIANLQFSTRGPGIVLCSKRSSGMSVGRIRSCSISAAPTARSAAARSETMVVAVRGQTMRGAWL